MNKTLLIGQLKAIADPFYTHLHAAAPVWLEAERTANGTHHPNSIFPWTTATADDNNKGMANIGQLKAVFSLRFGHDADIDGMPGLWEAAHGFDNDNPADAQADPDGDGITNALEFQLGTDPNTQNPIGPRNLGFGDEITDSPDLSFRPENPSDLYPEDSVPHWRAAIGQHIEIWDEGDGNPYAELQSHWDAKGIEQQFNMLPGTRLTFILRYKGRYDGYNDSNPFKLKVEGAYDVTVDGQLAPTVGTSHQESFMTDDEWEKYEEWHYASIAIIADPHATTLVPITLTLIPEDTDEAITYGGFVDLVSVEVEDNVIATGVDRISRKVSVFDQGFQEDFWIMAPLQGPGAFAYENLTKFRIDMGNGDTGDLLCANATPDPVTVALDRGFRNVLWRGLGNGIDSEERVGMKINGSDGETALPVKVKAMKYRTVKLRVCRVVKDLGDGAIVDIDGSIIPDGEELEEYLNRLFGYQLNAWFDVTIHPDTHKLPFGDFHVDNPHDPVQTLAYDKFNEHDQYDMQLFIVGKNGPFAGPYSYTIGYASIDNRTCWVLGKKEGSYNSKQRVIETIGHEIGHVLFGSGHPNETDPINRGVAPLVGTDHTKRLMDKANAADSRLIVKKEWDKAEEWLKLRPRGDQ